jgi:hypothetical protein
MSSEQHFLKLVDENSITKTYKREFPPGRPINVIVNVNEDRLKIYSPEIKNFHPSRFHLDSYYPKKSLEEKMDRAVVEYLGMLNDICSPGD